jgi:hypothetical protein
MNMGPPPVSPREACIVQAAARYGAQPDIVRALIKTEGGVTGKVSWNRNGSYDMGLMQINSINLPEMARYGISGSMLINNECLNIFIGTFLLQRNILQTGNFWYGVGSYHSKTPAKNIAYQYRVWNQLQKIQYQRMSFQGVLP